MKAVNLSSYLIILICLILINCKTSIRHVHYTELTPGPYLDLNKAGQAVLYVNHSSKHSALFIKDVHFSIDNSSRIVLISAIQGFTRQEQQKVFIIPIAKDQIMSFTYYWLDPDGKKHQLAFG